MKQTIYLLIAALLYMHPALAQNNLRITGTVISAETKQPVEGATIKIKGEPQTTITNSDGAFSIPASQNNPVLIISHIGYKESKIKPGVNNLSGIVITLEKNEVAMQEVTVSTGYQQTSKENTTGSFDKIDEKLLNRSVSTDILSRLEGTASSVYFSKTSTYPEIFIRGISTINAGTAPLIVVDNFPYEGDINNINPNDVQSVTILKDASASAIWGAKAGNGVIVITTKKGEYNQKSRIVFNANTTIQQKPDLFKDPNFLDTKDFIDVEKYLFSNGKYNRDFTNMRRPVISPVVEILASQRDGLISQTDAAQQIGTLSLNDVRNDYSKYLYQNSVNQQYSLNLSGGGALINYFLAGGLDNDVFNLVGNKSQRATFYSATTIRPVKNLELNASVNYSFTKEINNSILPDLYPGGNKSVYYPYARLADDSGNPLPLEKNYRMKFVDTAGGGLLLDWKYNPLEEQKLKDNSNTLQDVLLKGSAKYHFSNSLNAEFSGQLEKSNGNKRVYYNQETFLARDMMNLYSQNMGNSVIHNIPQGGIIDNSSSALSAYALRGQLNYNRKNKNSQFDMIAGGEIRQTHSTSLAGRTYGYDDNLLTFAPVDYVSIFNLYDNLGEEPVINMTDFSDVLYRYLSIYSNAAYTYKNKYTVSASGRRDASNLFGVNTNQKWNPLWSAGVAWKVSDESFYHSELFPYVRLRLSYGYNGNFQNDLSGLATIIYSAGSPPINLPYARVSNPANPDLRWEKTRILNAALDFATKNNRVQGSIEYYHKNSIDLLSPVPLDGTTGAMNMTMNSANLSGKGIDLKINSRIIDRKLKWDIQFLFNYVTNKVTRYLLSYSDKGGYAGGGNVINPVEGLDPYALISYRWGGLDHQTGNPLGFDHDTLSQDYSTITYPDSFDNMVLNETSRPPYYGNVISAFSWKGISISANISYKFHYYFRKNSIDYGALFNNWKGNIDFEKRWQKPGDELFTNVPSMIYPSNYYRDRFYNYSEATVVKGDQIRVQDINISYSPRDLHIGKYNLKNVMFYTYLNNVGLLWTKNKEGIDPDYQNNMPPRLSISFGIKSSF